MDTSYNIGNEMDANMFNQYMYKVCVSLLINRDSFISKEKIININRGIAAIFSLYRSLLSNATTQHQQQKRRESILPSYENLIFISRAK
jgi:hypothetical protein